MNATLEPGTITPTVTTSGARRLASNSAIYLLSNVLTAVVPFALLPVLTRYLDPVEYGQVAMFQTLVAAFAAFTGLNVIGAATRKYYDGDVSKSDMAQFIGACLQILMVSTLAALVIAYQFRVNLARWLGLDPSWVPWAVIVAAAGFVSMLRLSQWQVRGQAVRYGALQVSQGLAGMLLSLVLVVGLAQGAAGRIHAQIWVMPLFALLALLLLSKDRLLQLPLSWRPDYWREALKFGFPLIPHVAGIFLLSAADRFLINDQLGLGQAGIYMVAVQLTMAISIVLDAVNKAYVPWLFERLQRDVADEKQQIVRWSYWYFAALLLAAGLAFVFAPYVVGLVAGEQYREASGAIGWLALGHAFGGMYMTVGNYVFYSKRTGLMSLVTIGSGILNVALLMLLIRRLGINGAALAFAVAMGVRFIFTWWVAQHRHPMPWFAGNQNFLRIHND